MNAPEFFLFLGQSQGNAALPGVVLKPLGSPACSSALLRRSLLLLPVPLPFPGVTALSPCYHSSWQRRTIEPRDASRSGSAPGNVVLDLRVNSLVEEVESPLEAPLRYWGDPLKGCLRGGVASQSLSCLGRCVLSSRLAGRVLFLTTHRVSSPLLPPR